MNFKDYFAELKKGNRIEQLVKKHIQTANNDYELAAVMEFVLDVLYQYSKIAKDEAEDTFSYKDMLGTILKEKPS